MALALNNAASEGPSISTSANDTSGLLDFLDINPVLPVGSIVDPAQQVLPVQQGTDNLIDMLDLSNDKVDTISNNDLDSLLEEASKIEVSKELEAVFKSPAAEDNSKQFNLLQPAQPAPVAAKPVMQAAKPVNVTVQPVVKAVKPVVKAVEPVSTVVKPVNKAVQPVNKTATKPVEKLVPITKSNLVTVTKANINPTKASTNPTTVPIIIPTTTSAAATAAAVAANLSVTEAFKVLGTTTNKPVISLQGQQLLNLLTTRIVNSSSKTVSSLLKNPAVLSAANPGTSSATTMIDRR